jgi:hypothetical protein
MNCGLLCLIFHIKSSYPYLHLVTDNPDVEARANKGGGAKIAGPCDIVITLGELHPFNKHLTSLPEITIVIFFSFHFTNKTHNNTTNYTTSMNATSLFLLLLCEPQLREPTFPSHRMEEYLWT